MENSKHEELQPFKRSPLSTSKSRNNPKAQYEFINPEIASEYLKRNKCNRPLRQSTLKRYARDMSEGHWRETHQGIAFDREGNLVDGQHRLYALIEANMSFNFLVVRELKKNSNEGIDNGLNRGVVDMLHYRGLQADQLEAGLVRWMTYNVKEGIHTIKGSTRTERVEFYIEHQEAITFTTTMFKSITPTPRMRLSCVLAVFARAYYARGVKKKLAQAAEILMTGVGTGEQSERWIILLRNFLLYQKSVAGEVIRREIYQKTERALYAYLHDEEVLANLRPAKDELFPLPGEKRKNRQAVEEVEE